MKPSKIMQMANSGGGGGGPSPEVWELVEARNCASSPAANQDFVGLGGYDELLVVFDALTASGASARRLYASTDNGSTFYTTSGDYRLVSGTGGSSNQSEWLATNVNSSSAQYGFFHCPNLTGLVKPALSSVHSGGSQKVFWASSSRVNAIRVATGTADTLNGGTIYVYARTAPWDALGSWSGGSSPNVDFTGLEDYDELLVTLKSVTCSPSANRRLRYSVDAGSSFYAGASDYQRELTVAGAISNWTEAQLCSADATSGLSFAHHLFNSKGAVKTGFSLGGREDNSSQDPGSIFAASASQVDALRVTTGTASNLLAGNIDVYGRAKPWTLIEARDCAASPAVNQDFLNLDDYEELVFYMAGVGASGSASRNLMGSCDNGSTWENGSTDYYRNLTQGGAKSDGTVFATLSAQSSAARSMLCHFPYIRGAVKPCLTTSNYSFTMLVGNSNPMNALRLSSDTAFTLNSGTIYLFGRA